MDEEQYISSLNTTYARCSNLWETMVKLAGQEAASGPVQILYCYFINVSMYIGNMLCLLAILQCS